MIFALFGFLITSIGVPPVFGENGTIVVNTDKLSYSDGDMILISGEIKNMIPGDQLSIIIQSPNGNLVGLDQLTVGADNQFSTEIKVGGKLMKTEGTYTIKVQYRDQSANTSFEFGGVTSSTSNALNEVNVNESIINESIINDPIIVNSIVTETTIAVQDSTDLVSYEIVNAKLINVIPDMDAVSLLIYIESIDDGSITLTIPRSVLDAIINNDDDEFFVLVDGEEVDFEEITTSTDRTLIIEFLAVLSKLKLSVPL